MYRPPAKTERDHAEWLEHQRTAFVHNELSESKIAALDRFPFEWFSLDAMDRLEIERFRVWYALGIWGSAEKQRVESKIPGFQWRSFEEYMAGVEEWRKEHPGCGPPRIGEFHGDMCIGFFVVSAQDAYKR